MLEKCRSLSVTFTPSGELEAPFSGGVKTPQLRPFCFFSFTSTQAARLKTTISADGNQIKAKCWCVRALGSCLDSFQLCIEV